MNNIDNGIEMIANILNFENEFTTKVKKVTVINQMVLDYAWVSGDNNPIHIEDEAAREAGFPGGKIAHGTLLSGLVFSAIAEFFGHHLNILGLEVTFKRPVYVGAQIEIELTKDQGKHDDFQKINFKIKSETKGRWKLSSEGSVGCKATQLTCDKPNLQRTLMIAWLAKATVKNLDGVAVTHLSVNFNDIVLEDETPVLSSHNGPIDNKSATRETNFRGFYSSGDEIYSGYYVLRSADWKE